MANVCAFDMRVTGPERALNELVSMLRCEGTYENSGFTGVFQPIDVEEPEETDVSGIFEISCSGNCGWSILSSLQNYGGRHPSLESEAERLGLVIEVFSYEPGEGLQEHVLIAKDKVIRDECETFYRAHIGSCDNLVVYNEEHGTDFTEDMINDDGYVCIGGFGDKYCDFIDASVYFTPVLDKPVSGLDAVIFSCEEMSKSCDDCLVGKSIDLENMR